MAGRKLIVIGTAKGSQGPARAPGGGGTPPPALISATGSITGYQQDGNDTQPVFGGTATLDTGNPNYSHDKRIEVVALSPSSGPIIPLDGCIFYAPFSGSTITYTGSSSAILQTDAAQPGWGLKVTPYNEYNEPGVSTLIPSDYPTHSLTIAAAGITSLSATDDTADRWNDGPDGLGGAMHAVVPITVVCSNYPQPAVAIWYDSPQYGILWQGWFPIWGPFENVINLGAKPGSSLYNTAQPTAIYPPTGGDETVTIWAAIGTYGPLVDPTTLAGAVSATVVVHAPPAPAATAATGAWIDEILVYKTIGKFGWNNLYTTLPFDDPNFKGARWTTQNGHYATPGDPSTFVAGSSTTAQHGGLEVPFSDYDANTVYRQPDTNTVTLQNNNPADLWGIPDYILPGGAVNPDDVFRIKNLIASPLAAGPDNDATWTYQDDWSSGVGDPTAATYPFQDIVFDLSAGTVNAANLTPSSLGNGVGVAAGQLAVKLMPLGGLAFDSSGNTQANLGYTMQINSGGQIVLSNLPTYYGLPALPSSAYPAGSVILDLVDDKVYRNPTGGAWIKSSDPTDLVAGAVAGGVTLAAAQITAGTLTAGIELAGSVLVVNGTVTIELNSTNFVKVTDSGSSFYIQLRNTGLYTQGVSGGKTLSAGVSPGVVTAQSLTDGFAMTMGADASGAYMQFGPNRGFTGTLAAAIAAGKNVGGGIIY